MNITEAKKLAKEVAIKNKIFGWKIFFSKNDSMGGMCWHDEHVIEFGENFILDNDRDVCRNVFLHEIAHVFTGWDHQHDDTWKAKCVEIGAVPKEWMNDALDVFPQMKFPRHTNDMFDMFSPCMVTDQTDFIYITDSDQKLLGDGK